MKRSCVCANLEGALRNPQAAVSPSLINVPYDSWAAENPAATGSRVLLTFFKSFCITNGVIHDTTFCLTCLFCRCHARLGVCRRGDCPAEPDGSLPDRIRRRRVRPRTLARTLRRMPLNAVLWPFAERILAAGAASLLRLSGWLLAWSVGPLPQHAVSRSAPRRRLEVSLAGSSR